LYIQGQRKMENNFYIKYYSKSDGKHVIRPYDPKADMQHEFVASTGNLCKRYWDKSKEGLRTANAPWTILKKK
jgi:hypothetical protein